LFKQTEPLLFFHVVSKDTGFEPLIQGELQAKGFVTVTGTKVSYDLPDS